MGTHQRLRNMTITRLGIGPRGKGAALTLTKTVPGTFDPSTGTVTGDVLTDYQGSGLRVNYSSFAYKDTSVIHGDFKLYVSPVLQDGTDCPAPEIDDIILFLGKKYKVVNLEEWNAAGIICGWKLQMRKG